MKKAIFFIDGFNLYHAIACRPLLSPYKWLDMRGLASAFTRTDEIIREIYYFSALAYWRPHSAARHRLLINVYRDLGLKIVLGKFIEKPRRCSNCGYSWITHEEKRTDVNIGVKMLDLAYKNAFDVAFLVTGDGDLVPAIQHIRADFPQKEVKLVVPYGRSAKELTKYCNFKIRMKLDHISRNRLPDTYKTHDGLEISCPDKWKFPVTT